MHSITTTRREIFYWLTVYLTFSLGTAAGDFVSGTLAFGTLDSTLIFLGLILVALIGWKYGTTARAGLSPRRTPRSRPRADPVH